MSEPRQAFEIPRRIDQYLAMLSGMYEHDGERELQEIVVNGRVDVDEGWTAEQWDNETTYGHRLHLTVPLPLFYKSLRRKGELERNIENGLLQIVNVSGEHVSSVLIETDLPKNEKWREESGLLVTRERSVSQDATRRIWGDDPLFRIFLSHRAEVKDEVGRLQVSLQSFGISSFVAHKDIEATEEWQDEIESALATMDCFVALLTKDFHQSYWTDQEVGFAFARSVPIVPVRLGMDPYGFIGKFQALSSKWEDCALSIVKVLIKDDRVVKAYIRALPKCRNWDTANKMASLLPGIRRLTSDQIDDLVAAFNQNPELQTAHGFTGNRPDLYGAGLVWHLNRLGARTFYYDENRKIQVKP